MDVISHKLCVRFICSKMDKGATEVCAVFCYCLLWLDA